MAIGTSKQWYIMRDLKRSNAKLPGYVQLENEHIEVYTPMKERKVMKNNKQVSEIVPVVQDLLFVYDTYDRIAPIVRKTPTLQFRFRKGGKANEPMVMNDSDMRNFIKAGDDSPSTRYYFPEELTPKMLERKVRVVGGPFDQLEGMLLTIRGSKTKRLLVGLSSVLYKSIELQNYDSILEL